MDHSASREEDVGIDLESGTGVICSNEEGIPDPGLDEKLAKTIFFKLDDSSVKLGMNPLNVKEGSSEDNVKLLMDTKVERETVGNFMGKKMEKEKRKKGSSAKKPPRHPRPPRGFSLDQKLIKELAELAMIKRARNERMKALKQKKALKISSSSSSSSSSSNGSLFAMLFTIILFLVILLQGRVTFQGSPQMENGSIYLQAQLNPSASASDSIISPNSKSSTLLMF